MNIITFDSSLKRSAWARYCHGAVSWDARSFINLHPKNPDLRFHEWELWAANALDSAAPDLVVYEKPPQGNTSGAPLVMLEMTLRKLCAIRDIPVKSTRSQSLKLYITGSGKGGDKAPMMDAMAKRFPEYDPAQDEGGDVADSLALLVWAQDGCPPSKAEVARQAKKEKVTAEKVVNRKA